MYKEEQAEFAEVVAKHGARLAKCGVTRLAAPVD
jgi:hypothetical protein